MFNASKTATNLNYIKKFSSYLVSIIKISPLMLYSEKKTGVYCEIN